MKKVFLISGMGGAGIVAVGAGAGIGISSSSSSYGQEKPIESIQESNRKNTLDLGIASSPTENEKLSELTIYKPFEKELQEIKEMGEDSDISSKIKELEKNLDQVSGELLDGLEAKLEDQINKFKSSHSENRQKLFNFLGKIAEK